MQGENRRRRARNEPSAAAWGASTIVSLLQDHEFELLGLTDFEARVTQAFRWHWLPIADGGVPDESFEQMWTVDGGRPRPARASGHGRGDGAGALRAAAQATRGLLRHARPVILTGPCARVDRLAPIIGLRHTLANQGCCTRGKPGGR